MVKVTEGMATTSEESSGIDVSMGRVATERHGKSSIAL